jgi:uncharacterized protein YkwD
VKKGIFAALLVGSLLPVLTWMYKQVDYSFSVGVASYRFPVHSLEMEIFEIVNAERTSRGLSPLAIDGRLMQAAKIHSANMAAQHNMSHTLSVPDTGTLSKRLKFVGYTYSTAGENIAKGYKDAKDVMQGWMNSSGHRANILSSDYVHIGIAISKDKNGAPYYTQEFGTPYRTLYRKSRISESTPTKISVNDQKSISSLMITS